MESGRFAIVAAVTAAALSAGACAGGGEPADVDVPTPRPTVTQDLDDMAFVDRHPNGSTLQLRGIEVRARSLALELTVVNGFLDDITLTDDGLFSDAWLYLVDDLGNVYRYDGRADLTVGPGEELVGTLVFLGVVPEDARSVTLKSNVDDPAAAVDFRDRDRDDTTPVFAIEGIPVP